MCTYTLQYGTGSSIAIIGFAIWTERNHYTTQLKPVIWYFMMQMCILFGFCLSLSSPLLPPSLSLLPPPQLPSNPHPVFDFANITPEVLENPLKNFPRLKDSEINTALSQYDKANESPSVEAGENSTGKERETALSKTTSTSLLSPLR